MHDLEPIDAYLGITAMVQCGLLMLRYVVCKLGFHSYSLTLEGMQHCGALDLSTRFFGLLPHIANLENNQIPHRPYLPINNSLFSSHTTVQYYSIFCFSPVSLLL